jgi:hypothetical protein
VVKMFKPQRNVFDLTHDVKLTCQMGELVPVMATDVVPGDKFNISAEALVRFQPLLAPVMHRFDVSIHYFFVPNRILWEGWDKWIVDEASVLHPPRFTLNAGIINFDATRANQTFPLFGYMGIQAPAAAQAATYNINALPFAAYQAIYNEYYRDQNLVPAIDYKLSNGDNAADLYTKWAILRKRAWEHDYFTSCLPWAQKGSAVDIPIGQITGDAEVKYNDPAVNNTVLTGTTANPDVDYGIATTGVQPGHLYADTDGLSVGATTINDLRKAFRLQEWLEKNARGGTRYVESILAHFGVKSPDARLQRPEYITGMKTPVVVSEVLNTAGATGSPVQGNMAGHAVSVTAGAGGSYYVQEHGWIMGIMSVMPKTAYYQGIPKKFLKLDQLDYFWPTFAHIGEQPVIKQELYSGTTTGNDVFGYVPRYAEYKFENNRVAGDLALSLEFWHEARKFSAMPSLNQTFIECTPSNRIFAVSGGETDRIIVQVLNKITAVRPMPKFGTPSF